MRDRINNAVEELDSIGRSIYLAEVAGWKELVSMAGMSSPLATAFDVLSIIIGAMVFALTTGTLQWLGVVLALAGGVGLLRRYFA